MLLEELCEEYNASETAILWCITDTPAIEEACLEYGIHEDYILSSSEFEDRCRLIVGDAIVVSKNVYNNYHTAWFIKQASENNIRLFILDDKTQTLEEYS